MFLTMSLEIAEGLKNAGNEVMIVTLSMDKEGEDTVRGMPVFRVLINENCNFGWGGILRLGLIGYWSSQALELYTRARSLVAAFNPDIIETHDYFGLGFPWVMEGSYPVAMRCIGSLPVVMANGSLGDISPMELNIARAVELATITGADALMSLCHDLPARISQNSGLEPERFTIIRTPLTLGPEPTKKTGDGLAEGKFPQLFSWGRIDPQKGFDLIVEAMPAIKKRFPSVYLRIAGNESYCKEYSQNLKSRVEELQLSDSVSFEGELPRSDIQRFAVESDICIFASRYETACYACLEAMSYGCCVVAAAAGGLGEYVQDRKTGLLIAVDDRAALEASVIELSENTQLRERLAESGRASVMEMCSPARAIKETISVYREAIDSFQKGSRARERARSTVPNIMQFLAIASLDKSHGDAITKLAGENYANGFRDGRNYEQANFAARLAGQRPSMLRRIARKVKRLIK
ncbi:MAG: hypothetical protein C0469_01015 [Cyanobacteria bacterium DS2.3.42]|nr:hypothetical protein [Cyanobacteria bacterium DS2.3.42]